MSYRCEGCGSVSEAPGECTGPTGGFGHEPIERVAYVPETETVEVPADAPDVDPANGTEVHPG